MENEELIYFEGYCNVEKKVRKFLETTQGFAVCCSCPYRGQKERIIKDLNDLKGWENEARS